MPLSRLGYNADRIAAIAEVLLDDGEPHVSAPVGVEGWTAKQILGHLVDNASVNQERFVRAQCRDDLVFASYDAQRWVHLQHYNDADWEELVTLWAAINMHICHIVAMIEPERLDAPRQNHNLHEICDRDFPADQPATLWFLIEDHFSHLEHHLRRILGDVPD